MMEEKVFWGEQGEFGPFARQKDGWPNAGEVIRDYRRINNMSAETLAQCYGEEVAKYFENGDGTKVTARWILKMEQKNQIPTDIIRRRILADILHIPPLLLGLASLEAITPRQTVHLKAPPVLAYNSLDLEWYDKEARMLWQLHYAQTAQDALTDLVAYINNLLPVQQHAKGNLGRRINELLNNYYRLAATVQRDRGNFEKAYIFANESVQAAKGMGTDPYALQITAASQYTRGVVNFAWGVFGDCVKHGYVHSDKEKVQAALFDFEQALKYASSQLKGIIYSEMARAKALIAQSPTDMTIALKLLEQAEQFLDTDNQNDFYAQILLNGDLKGLDKKRLILGRAKTFLAMKRPGKALDEFSDLEMLEGSEHTRRRGWTQVLYAQAAFELGDFSSTTEKLLSAFSSCREAHSITHLARVKELQLQLLSSSYKNNTEVRRLGKLLEEVFPQKH
jgi:hypothetical protein